jgi:hypothetical protein
MYFLILNLSQEVLLLLIVHHQQGKVTGPLVRGLAKHVV